MYLFIFFIFGTLLCSLVHAMDAMQSFLVQTASPFYVTALLELQSIAEKHGDQDKIVLLPRQFRHDALCKDITDNKLFIARDAKTENIVGVKKLYIMDDPTTIDTVLTQELRVGSSGETYNCYNNLIKCAPMSARTFVFDYRQDIVLYNGADFTHPEARNRGVNSLLTHKALQAIIPHVCLRLPTNTGVKRIILSFGLTKFNAGELPNGIDRTFSLIKAFDTFVRVIEREYNRSFTDIKIEHFRYPAYMPTFDPHATECIPLPDDHAVAGYGNLLIYTFNTQAGVNL